MVVPAPADGRRTGRRGTEHMFGNKADIARLRTRKEAVLQRTQASSGGPSSGSKSKRKIQIVAAVAATLGILGTGLVTGANSPASAGTVGSGFTVTASDLAFILKQIKIAERHVRSINGPFVDTDADPATPKVNADGQAENPNTDPTQPLYDPEYCASLVGPAVDQIPDALTSYGLRLVDGGCNNLVSQLTRADGSIVNGDAATPGVIRPNFAAADKAFPRLTAAKFRDAEGRPRDLFGIGTDPTDSSSYTQKTGDVYDS